MSWQIEHGELICNGQIVDFDLPIFKAIEISGIIVVVLDVPRNQSMTENVLGVLPNGTLVWQIEKIPDLSMHPANCYTGVREGPSGTAIVFNWSCIDVTIDVKTGKVLDSRITK